jgi:hypothetical protein
VIAARLATQDAIAYNAKLAQGIAHADGSDVRPIYTQVWGHSEGSIIANAAVNGLDLGEEVRGSVDLRNLGLATGLAPAGLHSYVGVGNIHDIVYQTTGSGILANGGVTQSPGYVQGNLARDGSYKFVPTNFKVVDPTTGEYVPGESNHSWHYYMSDPTTRDAFGFTPELTPALQRMYGRSMWVVKE